MASAGEREFARLRETRPRCAKGDVGILRRGGILRGTRRQERYLVDDVLHLVAERLRRGRRRRHAVPQVGLGVDVSPEVGRGAEAFTGACPALERRLNYSYHAAYCLSAGVARASLMSLQGCGRWECDFAMLANVAEVEVGLAGSGGKLCGWRRKAQGGCAGIGRDMSNLLKGRCR